MAFDAENPYTIAGKNVQGGLPTNLQQLRFNATTNEWEFFTPTAAGGLGDLEFLRDEELAGDLIIAEGTRSASVGTIAAITPASGITFFIAGASVTFKTTSAAASTTGTIELQNNAVVVTTWNIILRLDTSTATFGQGSVVKGDSLIGDGAVTYRLQFTITGTDTDVDGTLFGWFDTT